MGKAKVTAILCMAAIVGSTPLAAEKPAPLRTVPELDAARYLGTWYEIARFQHVFEKDLVGCRAEYTALSDGRIRVVNSGFRGTLDGKYKKAKAVAWIPDPARPAALKVQFFWPFAGDYLVFGLDAKDYQWALVGDNSRKFLWFLSRTPEVSPELLESMKAAAVAAGYDLSGLFLVPQKKR